MFQITPPAVRELRLAAQRSAAAGAALRIAARRSGDGEVQIGMGFDDEREHDQRVDFDGFTVLLGAASQHLLHDAVLDFVEVQPGRHEFVFAPAGDAPACAPAASCGSGGCSRCGG